MFTLLYVTPSQRVWSKNGRCKILNCIDSMCIKHIHSTRKFSLNPNLSVCTLPNIRYSHTGFHDNIHADTLEYTYSIWLFIITVVSNFMNITKNSIQITHECQKNMNTDVLTAFIEKALIDCWRNVASCYLTETDALKILKVCLTQGLLRSTKINVSTKSVRRYHVNTLLSLWPNFIKTQWLLQKIWLPNVDNLLHFCCSNYE